MKLKKVMLTLTAVLISIGFIGFQNISLGATVAPPLYLGVTELRDSGTGYAIGDPNTNGSTPETIRASKIWNIVKYSTETANDPTQTNLYCVKAGVGFSDINKRETYNVSYNMKTERTQIAAQNAVLSELVNGGKYNELLALADLVYLSDQSTVDEKTALLEAAGIRVENWDGTTILTNDDIQAVQQAAIWYFTNYGETPVDGKAKYDKYNNTDWLNYTINGTTYQNLSDYKRHDTDEGLIRNEQAEMLYKYLIDTSNANASKYAEGVIATKTSMILYASTTNGQAQPIMEIKKDKGEFDLALRKYITKINNIELTGNTTRVPVINLASLDTGNTAIYNHKKDPVKVNTGDKVTYKITIYNEGKKEGRVTKIIDQLPTGLKFNKIISGNFELDVYDQTNNALKLKRISTNSTNLKGYTTNNLQSETIEIECEVTGKPDKAKETILTNVAWISEEYNAIDNITITNQKSEDRDSEPLTNPNVNKDNMSTYKGNSSNKVELSDSLYFYKGEQDDDDFEKLVLLPESFDLKLIKRIVEVNTQKVPERIEKIDVSKLNTINTEGNLITTAEYTLNKEPVGVKKGDIVTYTFRIYNEGTIDGYAKEITEEIPEGLKFLWSEKSGSELVGDTILTDEEKEAIEYNQKYLWGKFVYDTKGENIIQISSDYLSKGNETTVGGNLIKSFGKNDGTKTEADLNYKEVSVKLKVVSDNVAGSIIRNEAAITDDSDSNDNLIDDRDSDPSKWVKYEDDEDYDNVILQAFDLSLRKFITAVSKDEIIDEKEYLKNDNGSYKRAPVLDTSKLNTTDESGKLVTTATYNHTKQPLIVQPNDIVLYMLRVYNEGEIDGYATEITDYLPPYLEFVDSQFNKQYGWKVVSDGRAISTEYLNNSKISKIQTDKDGKIILSYKEVPVMCKVKENAKTSENITNIAEITKYADENKRTVTDRDSQANNVVLPEDKDLPTYKENEKGSYVPGQQDDDDFEKVIIKIFDLALRKWVTQAIVIEDGVENIINTGHKPFDDPEEVVKVEIHRKKLDKVTVKFRYSIRIYNKGEIAGYAKEIKDYIPEGLKFIKEDNPGWTELENNLIATKLLENKLLQPGEYADVEVLLTWINNKENLGLKINTAEISKDYNEEEIPDINSTPDNQVRGENDIDDAPVMVTVSTGQERIYYTLIFIVLITIAGGVVLIKKYVI